MKKSIVLVALISVILLLSATFCSAASTSQALSTDEVLSIISSSDPMGLNPPYEYDSNTKEYIEPIQRSLTLRENILHLPGKNGLDVNLNCSYNNHDSSVSFTKDESYFEDAFSYYTYCYSYTEEDGDTRNIYILFDTEDVMLEKAPISFTAEALPTVKTDDYGDKYYKYTTFDLADEGITFTRRVDMKPFVIEFSKSTKMIESDINTSRLKVGDLWKWELPTIFSRINPSKTDWDEDTYYYDLYTAFTDIDNEYWSLHFAYDEDRDSDEIIYTNIKPQNTKFLTWYDSVLGDIYDEEKGISYCCRIQDTQGRMMYFNYNGFISAVEDRFGNMIKYTFEDDMLTKIEDTLGRIVSIIYDEGQVLIYVDYDGNGPEAAKLHTKLLYSSENNNELDPNNYLIADDSYVNKVVRFEDDNTEYTCTYDYKKGYARSYISSISYNIQTPCSIVTKITHPNNLITEYSYVRGSQSGYISKNDFRVSKRTDIDNNEKKNEISYATASTTSSYVATREANGETTTYSGTDVITSKTTAYDDVEFYEKYEYTTTKKQKRKSITQKYTNGSTSGVERTISTPITSYLPKGISYDDYNKTITYHDNSNFVATEIYNQSEDVFVKTTYTLSPEGDDFYTGRTIDSATISHSSDGGETYVDQYTVVYTYNADGTLASQAVDPDGINQITSYTYTYSADGSITTTATVGNLKDADGNPVADITTSTTVDYLGRLVSSTDGNGNETTYEYDRLNRLVKVTNPDDTTVTYEYDTQNRTTIVTDENGVMEKAKYDGFGNILAVYKNTGTSSSPVWVAVAEYEYDALCRPVKATQYTLYNASNAPEKWVETHYAYTAFDNVSEISVYDEEGTELSNETYTYNFADRIGISSSAIEAHDVTNGGTTRKFTSVTVEFAPKDGITPPTVKQYLDRQGRLCKQITTDGDNEYISTYIYDALGNVLEYKDESAYADYDVDYSQKFEYNYSNQVVKAYNADGNFITNTYDALGRQLSTTDYMGNTQTCTYDSIGRVLTASAPVDDNVESLTKNYYDANSNVTRQVVSAAAGDITYTYAYDSLNRPVSSFNGATYSLNEYNGSHLIRTASGIANCENVEISELSPFDTTYNVTFFTYDNFGNVANETTFNGTTTYTYDLAGNTLATTDPKGITTTNTYDSRGNLLTSTALDDVISYEYNSFNLVTKATRNNVATTYAYDNFSRNITETVGADVINRTYNTAGQVASMTLIRNGTALQSAEYEYNVLGNMTSASDGIDTVVYSYNENGLPIGEEKAGLITTYEYTPGNLMKSTTNTRRWFNDPTDEEGYNTLYDISSFEYSYYPDGNVKTVTDTRGSTTYETIYGYDSANRLIIANITQDGKRVRTWGYSYNNRGDRISQTVTDAEDVCIATTYTYTNHRLTRESTVGSTTTYTYDANGNTLTKTIGDATTEFTYTPRNEVATVTTNGTTYDYTYNASSLRTSKTVDGVTTNFIWAGGNIIREETPTKAMDYFYGINRVSRHVTGDVYTYDVTENTYDDEDNRITITTPVNGYHEYYAYDGRGNVVHTMALDSIDLYLSPFYGSALPIPEIDTNADGKADLIDINNLSRDYPIVQNYYYSPFGEIWQGERTNDTNPFRYAGEYYDTETGDIYLRARYYDPSIGRFLTIDPIKDGTNWYVYCSNNPIAFVDPWGLTEVMVEYIAEKNGGTVTYHKSDNNGTSEEYITVTINGISKNYFISGNSSQVSVINNRYIIDNQVLIDDFNLNDTSSTHQEKDLFNSADDAALAFGLMYHQKSINERQEYSASINVRWQREGDVFWFDNVCNSSMMPTVADPNNLTDEERMTVGVYFDENTYAAIHTHWHPNGNLNFTNPEDYNAPTYKNVLYLVNRNFEFMYSHRTNSANNINGFSVGVRKF